MTDTEQQINQWFASHMEHTAQAASTVGPAIEEVTDAFVNALLQDGKIITSRNPGDIPAFSKALIEMLGETVEQDQLEAA